jgi:hypothetical protein
MGGGYVDERSTASGRGCAVAELSTNRSDDEEE